MIKKEIIGTLCTAALLSSCGGSGGDSSDESKNIIPYTTLSETPVTMTKSAKNCSFSTFGAGERKEFGIRMYNESIRGVGAYVLDYTNQIDGLLIKSVGGQPISSTNYGKKTESIISATFNEWSDTYDYSVGSEKVSSYAKALGVCPGDTYYGGYTFEGSALSWSYSVTKTFEAINAVMPEAKFKAVDMHISPLQKTVMKFDGGDADKVEYTAYKTDNAYYNPMDQSLTILPQSQEQKNQGNLPFWEVPMVASHEYGHHVFTTLAMGSSNSSILGEMKIHNCFETEQTHAAISEMYNEQYAASGSASSRGELLSFIVGSINEGFADLISYYTLDNDERSVNGVGCFIKTRDVGSSEFGDGTKKDFRADVSTYMDLSYTVEKDQDCTTPDHQEIHSVGAIFASVVNRYLSSESLTKAQKLKVTLQYAKELGKMDELPTKTPSKFMLYSMEKIAELTKAIKGETATNEDCVAIMKEYFSGTFGSSYSWNSDNLASKCMILK